MCVFKYSPTFNTQNILEVLTKDVFSKNQKQKHDDDGDAYGVLRSFRKMQSLQDKEHSFSTEK